MFQEDTTNILQPNNYARDTQTPFLEVGMPKNFKALQNKLDSKQKIDNLLQFGVKNSVENCKNAIRRLPARFFSCTIR